MRPAPVTTVSSGRSDDVDRHLALLGEQHVETAQEAPAAREEHARLEHVVRELGRRLGEREPRRLDDAARSGSPIAWRISSAVTFTSTVFPVASSRPITIAAFGRVPGRRTRSRS